MFSNIFSGESLKKNYRYFFYFFSVLFLLIPSSLVAYSISDQLRINGFGTLGVSTNDRDDILYHAHGESSLVGKNEFNFHTNTVAGLQGTLNLSDAFSVTAQGVIRDHQQDHWKTELQWAYMQYETPLDVTLRLGQFRLPVFQTTELAYVGYSRTWANPAVSFYGISGFEFMQGAQLLYTLNFDSFDITLRANYGRSDDELPKPQDPNIKSIDLETNDILITSAQFSNEYFWINVAYAQLSATAKTHLVGGIVKERKLNNKTFSAEYNLDYKGLNLEGGLAVGNNDGLPDEYLKYQSIAYRIGSFKPYLLYSEKRFKNNPGPQVDESKTRDIRRAIGCRYDVYPGIALKYQFDQIDNGYSPVSTTNKSGDTGINRVHTLVVDWMF